MKKFDFTIYKETRKYFNLFDTYMKLHLVAKKEIFAELFINNSSYRRCRDSEQKMAIGLINKIGCHFNFKIPTRHDVDVLEELCNKIYHNMYYKIYNTYDEDVDNIDSIINENNLLFPIAKLLKLFLVVHSKKSAENLYQEYNDLYNEVKEYVTFYNDELIDIFDILSLFYDKSYLEDGSWIKENTNPMAYQIASSNCFINNKYIEAIYFAERAKEKYILDLNFKRILVVNKTIMSCLLYINNYNECYELSLKQELCLKSLDLMTSEYKNVIKFKVISLLGIRRYNQVIDLLINLDSMNLTLLTCLLISLYQTDQTKYLAYYNDFKLNIDDSDYSIYLNYLDKYLHTRNKNILNNIFEYEIVKSLKNILKKL